MQKISVGWGACPRGHAFRAPGPPPFYFPGSAPASKGKGNKNNNNVLHN